MASSSSTTPQESKILILKSSDGEEFEIEESIASIAKGFKNKLIKVVRKIFNITNDYIPEEEVESIAEGIKNKSIKAVRKIFNSTNYYIPKEEAEVRDEHKWAHEEGEIDESIDLVLD
ncbi:SKP1-like protein 14 [Lycium barbarum]|uniref:SKP1-like protein 14 n=1 Tax=Lycium barbarum TaxID=112863 RepID=UPI00293E26E7|nr:SKP1-like protein 14 [Lycium barbarum]